tara:strand:+ start:2165 stop:2464 length:300 start_codon:yes stop_codon:yes gene_type:complete
MIVVGLTMFCRRGLVKKVVSAPLGASLFILLVDKLKVRELGRLFADFSSLLILDIVCTVFSFVLSVQLVKKVSPNSVVMAVNLELILPIVTGPADLVRE